MTVEPDLSKTAAAERYGLRPEDLSREIKEERISVARWVGGLPRLDPSTLARELDERRCPRCRKITLSKTGVCRDCVPSVLQKGKPRSAEARAKISEANRKACQGSPKFPKADHRNSPPPVRAL